MRTILAAAVILATFPSAAIANEPLSPDCIAAAERMLQAMAEISPQFRDALTADKADDTVTKTASDLQADHSCGLVLMLPDSSLRAMALQGTR